MRMMIGRRFVIILIFLFPIVILSVLAQRARYSMSSYTGPDGCTIDSCDCTKETEQLEDDMGNSITLERTTCDERDPERLKYYNFFGMGSHLPQFLYQITNKMFRVANRTKTAVVGSAGRIPEVVARNTVQVITSGAGLINISQVTVGVQSFWNTCMGAVNQYLESGVTYSNWEGMENDTTKPKMGANLFPSFTTLNRFMAYFGSLSSVIHGNNEFSSKLYNVISTSNPNNLLLSPLGVSILMAMLHTGALGETEETLRTIMAFPSNDLELVMGYQSLINKLNQVNDGATLNLISGVFVNRSVDLNPIFNDTLAQYFNVKMEPLDFTQVGMSSAYINSFVSTASNDHVKDILTDCFTGWERLVVVNALYFNNSWYTPFPKENTRNMAFHISATSHVKVDMMNMKGEILSGGIRELDARAVSLPYENRRFSMVILLPFKRTSLHQMEKKLRDFALEQVLKRVTYRKLNLFLPKFKLESVLDLEIPLSELGLEPIFSEEANFSGISNEGHETLALSKVVQKVTLELNEEMTMPARPNDVISHASPSTMQGVSGYTLFFVGHPFFAMIYDHDLSTPVIMASIKNPSISFTNHGIPCAPSSSSGARSPLLIFIISFILNAMQ